MWNPDVPQTIDFYDTWQKMPANRVYDNAFKVEWELFLRHVVEGAPFRWNLLEGAKGVQLAELGAAELAERRWLDVPPLDDREQHAMRDAHTLPAADGRLARYTLRGAADRDAPRRRGRAGIASRSRPRTSSPIRSPTAIRGSTRRSTGMRRSRTARYLWSQGFGVAEAMDTAQRGMGLDWPTSLELIRRSVAEARGIPRRGRVLAARAPITSTPDPRRHDRATSSPRTRAVRGDRSARAAASS